MSSVNEEKLSAHNNGNRCIGRVCERKVAGIKKETGIKHRHLKVDHHHDIILNYPWRIMALAVIRRFDLT